MVKKKISKKIMVGGVITIIYILATILASIKLYLQRVDGYYDLGYLAILFILGLAIYLTPAEALLHFDRRTGYSLYKMAPDKETGLGCAGTFYTLFALAFMLVPTALSLVFLFT